MAQTKKIDQARWLEFLSMFSNGNRGRLVAIDVADMAIGDQPLTDAAQRRIRNMNKYINPNGVRTSCPAIPSFITLILLMVWFLLLGSASAESGKAGSPKPAQTDYGRIAGKWLRPDGGYVLELSDVKPEGKLKAAYFNPRPINVAKAEWRSVDDRIQVFVELRDVNYPGSTYTLVYDPEQDRLNGDYYQAVQKVTFDFIFIRKK